MSQRIHRALTLTLGAALVLAFAATPAHATLTPVNSAFTGSSRDATFTIDFRGAPITLRCPQTTVTGRTNGTGTAVSANFIFILRSGGITCVESLFGTSFTITSVGNFTIAVTSSTAGTNASASFSLDSGFQLTFTSITCAYTFRGPQGPFANAVTFVQATQTLTITLRGLAVTGNRCTPTGASFAGTFTMAPRVTVS